MTVVGVVTVIWRVAISFQKAEDRDNFTAQEIYEIKENMVRRTDWKIFVDSIYYYNFRMEEKMNDIRKGLNALRSSYVQYLRNDESLTKDDFLQYMEGIEFELKKKPGNSSWMIPLQLK
ncbi:MAG: hypothetical protein QHH74_11910 [Spirochaetota bacterium]|nr:hypothetical protein [Spirochaetota bacterium]